MAVVARFLVPTILLLVSTAGSGTAQVVQKNILFSQPSRSVTHDVSLLQNAGSRVAIVRSSQTMEMVENGEELVNSALYQWELLLSGLGIRYSVFDDSHLNRAVPMSIRVLILPAVESLSERQRERIREYMANGGGVIASGRTGFYDELGWRRGGDFLESAFGLRYRENLPPQKFGIMQVIHSRSDLADGIPPGFRLNISPPTPTAAVEARAAQSLGSLETYKSDDEPAFNGLTMTASGNAASANFFWTLFSPQHVSRGAEQQAMYQHLIINALARVSNSRSASIAHWPNGKAMALTLAVLPSPGFDPLTYFSNMSHLLHQMEENRIRASFYLASSEVTTFPTLYRRAIRTGSEIGLTADQDALMIDSTYEAQRTRLEKAVQALALKRAHGVYPPGGLIDPNTIRALHVVGAAYVVGVHQPLYVPSVLNWWEYADFREHFRDGWSMPPESADNLGRGVPLPEKPDIATIPLASAFGTSFQEAYRHVADAGGYLVLPFYPEQYGPFSTASKNLTAVFERADNGSVWTTTASDALIWWRERSNLRPSIVSSRPNELTVNLENVLNRPIENVVVDVRLRREIPVSLKLSAGAELLPVGPADTSVRVLIPTVNPGKSRITLSWDR